MNVYRIFKVHGRLIAFSLSLCRIFFRFSRPFSKIFFQRSKKQKSANRTCLSGAMSAKNKARCLLTGYLCSDMWFFRKNSPTEAILWDCISFAYFFLSLWCTLGVNWCTDWCTRGFFNPISGAINRALRRRGCGDQPSANGAFPRRFRDARRRSTYRRSRYPSSLSEADW